MATSRLLDGAEGDARTPTEYPETARRFRLATELYADRAAYLVTGSLHSALRRPGDAAYVVAVLVDHPRRIASGTTDERRLDSRLG